jgi:AcrR family transcriptional regulator
LDERREAFDSVHEATNYHHLDPTIEALDVNEPLRDASRVVEDTSTKHRILVATSEVLKRNGQTKLSLSEVAMQAGVSRPTLYRWFASKEKLLDAFGLFEQHEFDSGISKATAGLRGTDKLDAALRFIVEYQQSYSGVRVIDIEPEVTIAQLTEVIPVMRARLQRLLSGPNAAVKAATAIRVAVSHYIVRSDDADQFLAQLRHAVGIKHNG